MAGKQFDYTRRMETLFTQRVHNILQPVLGTGRYKAEVSADVDFSSVESTSEMFNPDQPALRSEQPVNEQRQSSLPPQGGPGALSNQPPGPAAAPEQAAGAAAPAGPVAAGQPLVDANGQQLMDPVTGQPMLAPYPADKREQSTRDVYKRQTVASLNNVKAARVHLAMPKASVFVRDERKPSASVLVELYPGRALEPSQVRAIVNLVATSVPELDKGQVTVVDQKGNLLSDQQELSELTMAGKQFDYTRRMETLFTQRVHNILQPVLGTGRYKAEVSADVDFSSVESTSEMFNPDQPALRSEQPVNEQRQSSLPPQGGPGALSNQPPGPAAAPEQAAGAAAPAGPVAAGQPLVDANGQQLMDPVTGQPMLAPYPADKREQSTRDVYKRQIPACAGMTSFPEFP